MLFKNQQKAVSNTTANNNGLELFGNGEFFDELDDVDLMGISGGVEVDTNKAPVGLPVNLNLVAHGQVSVISY